MKKRDFIVAVAVLLAIVAVVAVGIYLASDRKTKEDTQEGGEEAREQIEVDSSDFADTHLGAGTEVEGGSGDGASGGTDGSETGDANVDYTIEMSNFKYAPNVIRGKAGSTISVKLTSVQGMHDFVIDGQNINSGIVRQGESIIVDITLPNAPGSFTFYCSMPGHRAQGQVGTLIVE